MRLLLGDYDNNEYLRYETPASMHLDVSVYRSRSSKEWLMSAKMEEGGLQLRQVSWDAVN